MTSAATLDLRLADRIGDFTLDLATAIPLQGVTAIFGPSGCGKTTILRCIAGLQRIAGRIEVAGQCWQDTESGHFLPTFKREIGYVFQEASLFPHLSVERNLLYGAQRAKGHAANVQLDFAEVVDLLGLRPLLTRMPVTLSGGERQRVAVGRALLSRPRLLLMDEPLSALDRQTKADILPYFEMLKGAMGIPIIYVSHDISEVERLADRVLLIDKGRMAASGALQQLQTDATLSLLTAPDAAVSSPCRIVDYDPHYDLTRFELAGEFITIPGFAGEPGSTRRIRIAASDVSIAREAHAGSTIMNSLSARILSIEPHRQMSQVNVLLEVGTSGEPCTILARITRKSRDRLQLNPGDKVTAQIKSVALISAAAPAPPGGSG